MGELVSLMKLQVTLLQEIRTELMKLRYEIAASGDEADDDDWWRREESPV